MTTRASTLSGGFAAEGRGVCFDIRPRGQKTHVGIPLFCHGTHEFACHRHPPGLHIQAARSMPVNVTRQFRNGSRGEVVEHMYKFIVPFSYVYPPARDVSEIHIHTVPGTTLLLQEPDNIAHQSRDTVFVARALRHLEETRAGPVSGIVFLRYMPQVTRAHRLGSLRALFGRQGLPPLHTTNLRISTQPTPGSHLRTLLYTADFRSEEPLLPPGSFSSNATNSTTHVCFERLWEKTVLTSGDYRDGDAISSKTAQYCEREQPNRRPYTTPYVLLVQRPVGGARRFHDETVRFLIQSVRSHLRMDVVVFTFVGGNTTFCDQVQAFWNAHATIFTHGAEYGNAIFMQSSAWAIDLSLHSPDSSGNASYLKVEEDSRVGQSKRSTMSKHDEDLELARVDTGHYSGTHTEAFMLPILGKRLICIPVVWVQHDNHCKEAFRDSGCRLLVHTVRFEATLVHLSRLISRTIPAPQSELS